MIDFNTIGCSLDRWDRAADRLEQVFSMIVMILREHKSLHLQDQRALRKAMSNVLHLVADQLYYRPDMHERELAASEDIERWSKPATHGGVE